MNRDNLFLFLSALLALGSILFAGFTIFSPGTLDNLGITGFSAAGNQTTGIVNVTVQSALVINFTTDLIEWGSGKVDTGADNATLDTSRNATYKVLNGNWNLTTTNRTSGFILENIGNVNASIWLATSKNATNFMGGNNPAYQYNVTNNESNSCTPNLTYFNLSRYYDVNTTSIGTQVCAILDTNDLRDAIRIDILLRIPSGSGTGTLTDTITATAIAA